MNMECRPRDKGGSKIEYAALIAVVNVVVLGLNSTFAGSWPQKVESSICRIFSQGSCPAGEAALPQPPPPPPDPPCTVADTSVEKTKSVQVLLYSHKEKEKKVVIQRSDGEVWEVDGSENRNGIHVETGIGYKINDKKTGLTIAGGNEWSKTASTTWKFANEAQRQAFHAEFERQRTTLVKSKGPLKGLIEAERLKYTMADQWGIKYTISKGTGTNGYINGSLSFSAGKVKAKVGGIYEETHEVGTTTTSENEEIKTFMSKNAVTLGATGEAKTENKWLPSFALQATKDWSDGSTVSITYDIVQTPDGKEVKVPKTATIVTDSGSNHNLNAGATWELKFKDPKSLPTPSPAGGQWELRKDNPEGTLSYSKGGGGNAFTHIEISLQGDPHAQQVIQKYIAPPAAGAGYQGEMQSLADELAVLIQEKGKISTLSYDRDSSKKGADFGFTPGVKIAGLENSTETVRTALTDARIVDPKTGVSRPWICRTDRDPGTSRP
ncbi:hypothetical protein [Actinomadura rugatobispora]|uniref:Uncharacterized protein n=1 Tax=Actinomadura rugatobispora TaxID=1994 RepID=A0ABW0ZTI2_9ACTN